MAIRFSTLTFIAVGAYSILPGVDPQEMDYVARALGLDLSTRTTPFQGLTGWTFVGAKTNRGQISIETLRSICAKLEADCDAAFDQHPGGSKAGRERRAAAIDDAVDRALVALHPILGDEVLAIKETPTP